MTPSARRLFAWIRAHWLDLVLVALSAALVVYIIARFGIGAFLMHWKYEGAP